MSDATPATASPWTPIDDPRPASRNRGPDRRAYYRHADGRVCLRAAGQGPGKPCTEAGFMTFSPEIPAEAFE